jgi:pimeloyl-ACP methyl ester carboxylesterase
MSPARGKLFHMETILVPPLLCSTQVYTPILDTVWSYGAVTIADTRQDASIAAIAARVISDAPERFVLLGTSMGGYVALEIMRQAPERVAGLALVSTSARADSAGQIAARRSQSQLVRDGHFSELVDAAFPGVVAKRNESDPALLQVWRSMADAVGPDKFLQQQAAVMGRADSRDLLPGITCPTFIVHGAEDRLIPPSAGQEMAAAIPGATLRRVDAAGHFLLLERPTEANAVVDDFLQTVFDDQQ